MDKFDVVIIGSGLSGLQCAYILSREGMNVCVLEQHHQIGGCLQNFTRQNCVFDTGIHYIGSLDEGQVMNRYFRYFGITDKVTFKRLDDDGFDVIRFADDPTEYKLAMGFDNFVRKLLTYFPNEENTLKSYIQKLIYICDQFPLYRLSVRNSNFSELGFYSENACNYISTLSPNQKFRNVLAGNNLLYAGVADKTPLYVHALVNNSFIESSWRVVGGSALIAEALKEGIVKHGGVIRTNAKAKKIIIKNKQVYSILLENSEEIIGSKFISSIHPAKLLRMIDEEYLRSAYRNRIQSLPNTTSNFTLYVVFNDNAFPYLNYNYYYYDTDNVWLAETRADAGWPYTFLFVTPANTTHDTFATHAIVMTYMNIDDVRKWENTFSGQRGDDYLLFKEQMAQQIIDKVEKSFPGFRASIKKYYTSSPLTYRDYTGTVDGSMYGILRDSRDPLRTLISHKTKIPNLLLTGQNIILHGVLGVTIGSVTTCAEWLGIEYLVNKIKQASE